eukprot:TRINITY_DN3589_c0_g1_i4.p1 TRINITY_DN3589_c0_g1~~TRINITY_DN3589_c0_g1_i4.p1  ORF type:complete len:532 (+),score=161.05 TRINITY_DN3589_c0_g1_i4:62-1597(+)
MAALNIDKSLIDQSALVQSDEVIAMQNGCFCCTLQSDLVDQIISLTEKKLFNYMLIEASGVSEPSQIAPLFDLCDDEHDPEDPDADHDHDGKPQLGEVARLDTCITVVDSAEFYNNLASMKTYEQGETVGTIAELMMEQVEFSNVVVVNKGDLVSKKQKADIIGKIRLLNPNAKIVESIQSKVNVMEILNTHMFKAEDNKVEFWMKASKEAAELIDENGLECCEKSMAKDGKKCCKSKSKDGKLVDSGLSQVQLDVVANNNIKDRKITRHETRFGITSFIYRARRPFHPGRLVDLLLDPYFSKMEIEDEDEEDKLSEEEKVIWLQKIQKEAAAKQVKRTAIMGQLLRSKGFLWIATSHDIIGSWQQAGNVTRLEAESAWMCETREMWEDTPSAELILQDMKQPNGEEWKYLDRRQGLVFIGQGLKHETIQKILDKCLLDDKEMKMGPEKWGEAFADVDKIQLTLDFGDDEEGEEEEEEENDEDEGENDDAEEKELSDGSESPPVKKKRKSH